MAFDEYMADRIRNEFLIKKVSFHEKKMIGGLCFMVDEKMCVGTHIDKKTNQSLLMCRIGMDAYPEAIKRPGVLPMDFTGRVMKGYIFVTEEALDSDAELSHFIDLALAFNPFAKPSKKKKKK